MKKKKYLQDKKWVMIWVVVEMLLKQLVGQDCLWQRVSQCLLLQFLLEMFRQNLGGMDKELLGF
ncbi:MAG: hypothetical protein EBT17_06040 [Actinobacteria bacterium]|nr:hypothetical protein [Actinomycetota bacterium]